MELNFYDRFYRATATSRVHSAFCHEVFGIDLCQHGFMNFEQLKLAIRTAPIHANDQVLDLGCGNGMTAEYISDHTGAILTGIDNAAIAIQIALDRTSQKRQRLNFSVGDMNDLHLQTGIFDVILLSDTIYFSNNYDLTIAALKRSLKPSGRILMFYSIGPELLETECFPISFLEPDSTPLAQALLRTGFHISHHDLTSSDYFLAKARKAYLEQHAEEFRREGIEFIYQNRIDDSIGTMRAVENGLHRRYLYRSCVCNRM